MKQWFGNYVENAKEFVEAANDAENLDPETRHIDALIAGVYALEAVCAGLDRLDEALDKMAAELRSIHNQLDRIARD